MSGPMVGAELHAEVIRRAYGTCVCAGWCGRTHRQSYGRCDVVHTDARPLHAVPYDPVERTLTRGVAAMRLKANDLIALCAGCHHRIELSQDRADKAAAAAAAAAAAGLFDEPEKQPKRKGCR